MCGITLNMLKHSS